MISDKNFTVNSFQVNVPFLYPLKTSENQKFSDVSRGYRNGTLSCNELIKKELTETRRKTSEDWGKMQNYSSV